MKPLKVEAAYPIDRPWRGVKAIAVVRAFDTLLMRSWVSSTLVLKMWKMGSG